MHVCDCRAGLDRVARVVVRPEFWAAQAALLDRMGSDRRTMAERDFSTRCCEAYLRNPAFPEMLDAA